MNSTTKSCSTYLSQKRPQFLHTVSRILWPLDGSPAPEYWVHSVLTGCRHSMQIGISSKYLGTIAKEESLRISSCGYFGKRQRGIRDGRYE